jgi:hypothetical protein
MVNILQEARAQRKLRGGRENKSIIEETLLMTLEYLREYRSYFHISKSYGISEGYAYKVIRWVEDTLIKSKMFSLPGRKALLKSDVEYQLVLVDASEHPVQRPPKKIPLTKNDKITNRKLSSIRVLNEKVLVIQNTYTHSRRTRN